MEKKKKQIENVMEEEKKNEKGQTLKKERGESIECEEKEITIENNVDSLETLRERNHLFTLSVRI